MKLILKTICLTLNQMVVMDEVSFQQEASATEFDWLCHKYPIAKTNDWVPIPKVAFPNEFLSATLLPFSFMRFNCR